MRRPRHCRCVPALLLPLAIGSPLPAVAQTVADPPSVLHPPASDPPGTRLVRSLATIRAVEDPEPRASLLMDLLEDCAPSDCPAPSVQLLAEASTGVAAVREPARKAELLLRLARLQHHLDQPEQAAASLAAARKQAQGVKAAEQASLLLRVSLAYGALDREEESAVMLAEGARRMEEAAAPQAPFPFPAARPELELGFAVSGSSYVDTNALASFHLDFYGQGARQDLDVDLMVSADYDSSRDYNRVRPHGTGILVFRHHLDRRWNLFFDQLVSVNTDTFASRNDDEDLSAMVSAYAGAGLNLWRGRSPASFVELQFGAGVRYEYELIDYQLQRNQVDPSLVLVFRSRELSLGKARFNQTLALASSVRDWSNSFVWSTTELKLPLGERWWWSNELVLRYRRIPTAISYPTVTALFSTGFTYSF